VHPVEYIYKVLVFHSYILSLFPLTFTVVALKLTYTVSRILRKCSAVHNMQLQQWRHQNNRDDETTGDEEGGWQDNNEAHHWVSMESCTFHIAIAVFLF